MTFDPRRRPPVVTDADREWALRQEPGDWSERNGSRPKQTGLRFTAEGELIDGDGLDADDASDGNGGLPWAQHVDEQIEAFERYWSSTGDLKPASEWSGLWRRVHWPQADPSIRHPQVKGTPHPFVKRGEPAWDAAWRVCTPAERSFADRFGVIQFRPTDPRAVVLAGDDMASLTEGARYGAAVL